MSWTCLDCGGRWATEADLVAAFNAIAATLLNRILWPTPVTRARDVICCPSCLTERMG